MLELVPANKQRLLQIIGLSVIQSFAGITTETFNKVCFYILNVQPKTQCILRNTESPLWDERKYAF